MPSTNALPPRIYSDDGESTLLTDAIEVLIEEGGPMWCESQLVKRIALTGELLPEHIGYLSEWFKSNYSIAVRKAGELRNPDEPTVFIYTTPRSDIPCFELAGWGIFEFIDYLRLNGFDYEQVMKVVLTLDSQFASGSPSVWKPILNYLARKVEDQSVLSEPITLFGILSGLIAEELGDDLQELNSFLDRLVELRQAKPTYQDFGKLPFDVKSILRNQTALRPFLARRMAERLRLGDATVVQTWLLIETADWLDGYLRGDDEIKQVVEKDYASNPVNVGTHWTLLLMCDPSWHPKKVGDVHALCGNLQKARWSKLVAHKTAINRLSFEQADLSESNWNGCQCGGVDFTLANLSASTISSCSMNRSKFRFANLSNVTIDGCDFKASQMQDVILSDSLIRESRFPGSDFTGADLTSLIAKSCNFWDTTLDQAEFDNAFLEYCRFDSLDLRTVLFQGARIVRSSFTRTNFEDSRLEGEFRGCNFSNSLMTGSVASGVVLRDCDFSQAGLADIDWSRCDLRGAKFVDSAFHLGSTRCGTLDSPYPSYGTRTGYYTDDYEDLHFKNPESIRKAALVDCDLRGAILDQTDFYLVDLRGSKFDPRYEPHLRRCGAILDD